MKKLTDELDGILNEWYPTFNTHWEKFSDCPCKDCAAYRITQARTAIIELIKSKQMSERCPNCGGEYANACKL